MAQAAKTATGKAGWPANSMHWHALLSPSLLPHRCCRPDGCLQNQQTRPVQISGSRGALPI